MSTDEKIDQLLGVVASLKKTIETTATPSPDDLFTRNEAAAKLRICVRALDQLVADGLLEKQFPTGPVRFTRVTLDRYIRSGGKPMELRPVRRRQAAVTA